LALPTSLARRLNRLPGLSTRELPATCVPQIISLSRTARAKAHTDRTSFSHSNNSLPNQKRNLKPTVSAGAYSASPSQLTLGADQLPSNALGQHQYQSYGYPHDPSPFTFPQQPQYRHHQIPQQQPIKTDYHPQQLQQQQPNQLPSPVNVRKRRASELNEPSIPGSSSSNVSAFGNPHGPFSANPGGDVDLGLPSAQTLPSPLPKKGRTNTPWTPAEEQRLKTLRDAGSSWSEIAKTFPLRTEGSVKKHWYKVRICPLIPWFCNTGRLSAMFINRTLEQFFLPFKRFSNRIYTYMIVSPSDRTCTTPSSRKTRSAISSASHTRDHSRVRLLTIRTECSLDASYQRLRHQQVESNRTESWQARQGKQLSSLLSHFALCSFLGFMQYSSGSSELGQPKTFGTRRRGRL